MVGEIEHISDQETVSREIFHPLMTRAEVGVVYESLFEFPGGQPESVVWRRFCQTDLEVHGIGLSHETSKRVKKPDVLYLGFGTAGAGEIRTIADRNKDGHGFDVKHEPYEGIHHAEVSYQLFGDMPYSSLNRNQKQELKFTLGKLFKPITVRV
jgi:hypothetical protein